jgi:Fur family ferric uptake transcriptional regulator
MLPSCTVAWSKRTHTYPYPTVYRTVKRFEAEGILERHEFRDGRGRYEKTKKVHHDHLIDIVHRSGDRVQQC